MAIYSLNHKPIGKSTQKEPYTATAHIAYITRAKALHHMEVARMPETPAKAGDWLRQEENRDRANARVVDKVMLALPRELSPEQRIALVRAFAEDITQGRAPWLAAFHDNATDAHNPHCHLVIRDRDPATRKRVIATSEKGSTERLRQAWESHANAALAAAEREARIDRRTLVAQGLARRPTIHEGVRARRMRADGRVPGSRRRWYRNGVGAKRRRREVDYPSLDQGKTRAEVNQSRLHVPEADYWAAIHADTVAREMSALRAIHLPPEGRSARDAYRDYWLNYQRSRQSDAGRNDPDREWEPDD